MATSVEAPGAGPAIQLAAVGQQDVYLTLSPEITFWKFLYRRHTPFAVVTNEEIFPGGFSLGQTISMQLPRRGDLLGDIVLEINLPSLGPGARWVDKVGHVLLRRAKFLIDDAEIHNHERLWHDIADQVFGRAEHEAGLAEMIGQNLDASVPQLVYVPLKFLCCRAHHSKQNFLPILATPGSKIQLRIETETFANIVAVQPTPAASITQLDVKVLYDTVYLGEDERRHFLAQPIHMLFETVQDMDAVNYKLYAASDPTSQSDSKLPAVGVDLSELNHNVKALVWVAYAENYTTLFDYLPVLQSAVLIFASAQRFSERPIEYFQLVQPYQHFDKCRPDTISAYSFALDAESRQPCGSVNLSQVFKPRLRVNLRPGVSDRVKVKVFGIYYNFLTIYQGRASLQFT